MEKKCKCFYFILILIYQLIYIYFIYLFSGGKVECWSEQQSKTILKVTVILNFFQLIFNILAEDASPQTSSELAPQYNLCLMHLLPRWVWTQEEHVLSVWQQRASRRMEVTPTGITAGI